MRHGALDYLAVGHRREGIGVGPVAGLVIDVDVEFAGFEGLKGDAVVAIELHFHTVEVVLAAVDRDAVEQVEEVALDRVDLPLELGARPDLVVAAVDELEDWPVSRRLTVRPSDVVARARRVSRHESRTRARTTTPLFEKLHL